MADTRFTVPVVINTCYGGFGLSREAAEEVLRRKGIPYRIGPLGQPVIGDKWLNLDDVVPRHDPDLVAVVREMGKAANGESADLAVVDVKVEFDIVCCDGREEIRVHGFGRA